MLKSHARSRLKDRLRAISDEKHGSGHWTDGFLGADNEAVLLMLPVMFLCSPLASVVTFAPSAMLFLTDNILVILVAIIPALVIGATLALVMVFTMQRSPTSWIAYEWINVWLSFPVGLGLGYLIGMAIGMGWSWLFIGIPIGLGLLALHLRYRRRTIEKLHVVRRELGGMS